MTPPTRLLATLAIATLAGCVTYAPVVRDRPMYVQSTVLGQSEVIQDDRRVSWGDAVQELERVSASADEARAASRWAMGGSVAWVGGAATAGLGLGVLKDSPAAGLALVGGGVAMLAGGAWGWSVGTRHMAAAVSKYDGGLAPPARSASSGPHLEPWFSATTAANRRSCPVVGARLSF